MKKGGCTRGRHNSSQRGACSTRSSKQGTAKNSPGGGLHSLTHKKGAHAVTSTANAATNTANHSAAHVASGAPSKALQVFLAIALVVTLVPVTYLASRQAYAEEAPDFPSVTLNAGSKLYINNKSTSVVSSNQVIADTTSDEVEASQIQNQTNDFLKSQYSGDALGSTLLSNPKIPSHSNIESWKSYLSTSDKAYWLSETSSKYGIETRAIRNANNSKANVSYVLSGKAPDGTRLANTQVSLGSYDFVTKATLENYIVEEAEKFNVYGVITDVLLEDMWQNCMIIEGTTVYNNPYLLNDPSKGYYKTTIINSINGSVAAKVNNGSLEQVEQGYFTNETATYLLGGIYPDNLRNSSGFKEDSSSGQVLAFKEIKVITVVETGATHAISNAKATEYKGQITYSGPVAYNGAVEAGDYAVRPYFDVNTNNIAFLRSNTSGTTLTVSSALGDTPTKTARRNSSYKPVIKDSDITISSNLENAAANKGTTTFDAITDTINVPYGATELTIPITAQNANYISALTSYNRYGVISNTSSNSVTINLSSFINTKLIGSTEQVSLYAEQANAQGIADGISENHVSFTINVVEGDPHEVTYSLDGGTGTPPDGAAYNEGHSFAVADGSYFTNDGDPFSSWLAKWTEDGEEKTTSIQSGNMFVMPDSEVTFTAQYSSTTMVKDTSSEGAYVITFDAGGGNFGNSITEQIQRVTPGHSISALSAEPTRHGYSFTGWVLEGSDDSTLITAVDIVKIVPNSNATYLAQWKEKTLGAYFMATAKLSSTQLNSITAASDSVVKTADEIKVDSAQISSNNSSTINEYKKYMSQDSVHLYTKLSGYSGDNGWLECRIIGVQHDTKTNNTRASLTFQATHALPASYAMNSSKTNVGGWNSTQLRSKMQVNGEIYKLLNTNLTNAIVPVKKICLSGTSSAGSSSPTTSTVTTTDRLWLTSVYEMTGSLGSLKTQYFGSLASEGTVYDYWRGKASVDGGSNYTKVLRRTRQGYLNDSDSGASARVWLRSPIVTDSTNFDTIYAYSGVLGVQRGAANDKYAVVPCFCL